MRLFIKIKDNLPFEHPILEDNFKMVYPYIDINNLSPEFVEFEKVAPHRQLGPYEKLRCEYKLYDDNICREVWHYDLLSAEEIKTKQDLVKQVWVNSELTPKSWIFNEDKCEFEPPIPHPTDSKQYRWDESTISWIEIPVN